MENLGKRTGVSVASITYRIQEIEERISGVQDTIEDTDTTVKETTKSKKLLTQKRNPGLNGKTKPKNNRYKRE
jgi:cell division protein FtsL